MGQQCSCLQHPPKYQRRVSDASDADDDGATELGSIHVHRSGDELAGLLATDASSKAALQSQEEEEEKLGEGGGLLATEQLMLERLDDGLLSRGSSQQVLRSYQAATGVVDPGELDLECIMCLDTFSSDNPKLRTLCNCGMNRTNFHLSCLLEWLNRDANCPVCRTYLYYEDL